MGSFQINQAVPVLGFQQQFKRDRGLRQLSAEVKGETLSRMRGKESQHQRAVDTEDAEGNRCNGRTEGTSQKQPRVKGAAVGAWIELKNKSRIHAYSII